MNGESTQVDITSGPRYAETPTDVFRRKVALVILVVSGVVFAVVVGIAGWALLRGEKDSAMSAAQAVLTTTIGFIGGVMTSVVNYFFQRSDA